MFLCQCVPSSDIIILDSELSSSVLVLVDEDHQLFPFASGNYLIVILAANFNDLNNNIVPASDQNSRIDTFSSFCELILLHHRCHT